MQRNEGNAKFGDIVTEAYTLGASVAADKATAADLAARHLERVISRGGNARLIAALAELARELAPTTPGRFVRAEHLSLAAAR